MPAVPRSDSVTYVQPAPFSREIENGPDGQPIYVGFAVPRVGLSTADPVWQIQRIQYPTDATQSIRWADGDDRFDNVWDDRASLTYG